MKILEEVRCFEGRQLRVQHSAGATQCEMAFSIFLPPQSQQRSVPLVWWLSGLTCTDQNFVTKAGAQRVAADLGLAIVAPDTSPRGEQVPDDPEGAWDFGLGAGFYVNAIQEPWRQHYQMYTYILDELPALIGQHFPVDMTRQSILGHSMGGHGALILALKNPSLYRAVSAFAPICSPLHCPWGEKALSRYLGDDKTLWRDYDAVALIEKDGFDRPVLVDQGMSDPFLENQLRPELLEAACTKKQVELTLNCRDGYDHSYFFIASFMESHLRFHDRYLKM